MLRHTLLLIYRNFKRFRSTFLINLIGLSAGLACALLIYLWIMDELSIDKFHTNGSHLYQVMTNQNRPDDIVTLGWGPGHLAEELVEEMEDIEYAIGSSGAGSMFTLSTGEKNINSSGQFAGKEFFRMFSYPLLHGDRDKVLIDKNSIVLSETLAVALFNDAESAIGQMVDWQVPGFSQPALISGVFKDVPRVSSVQFDFVLPYDQYRDYMVENGSLSWGNHNAITYLQLRKNTDVDAFNRKIKDFIKVRDPNSNLTIFVKPYSERYLYGKYENGQLVGGRITYVRLFSAIAVFILLIACINFMNLATAKASRRIKEVGIKKAIGAERRVIIAQYLGESMMMSLLSIGVAVLIVDIAVPQFNVITGKNLVFDLDFNLVSTLLVIAVVTGLVAGSYPALYLSGFNPAIVLKDRLFTGTGEQWARKGLVVFQFTLSIIFIVCVWVTYEQMRFIQTKHLGLEREGVIFFRAEGNVPGKFETFVQELKELPAVIEASGMWGSVMGHTSFTTGSFDWKGRDPQEVIQFEHLGVQYGMIELLQIEMKEGRPFSRDFPTDTTAIILNETAIKVMGLEDPVGERFNLWGRDYKIIGVVKDFHFHSLHNDVKPFFFRVTPKELDKVLVRLAPGEHEKGIAQIEGLYKRVNPGFTFNYQFLDQEYQELYQAEQRVAVLSKYFAALAVLISCLGLFGLASFTAERRLREIGIRKVLGSSSVRIVTMLCDDFNRIVIVAIVLALPASYLITTMWLEGFAYRIELQWWYFVGTSLIALTIAWLTVGIQAWNAAGVNPVKCLRDE